jgi:hypothetical protein
MSDQTPNPSPRRPLSEISHLFLSSVREQAQASRPTRPQRIPPGAPRLPSNPAPIEADFIAPTQSHNDGATTSSYSPITPTPVGSDPDPTPKGPLWEDQLAQSLRSASTVAPVALDDVKRRRVTAIVTAHLSGSLIDRVHQYARELCEGDTRVGVIFVDGSEFRLTLVEAIDPESSSAQVNEVLDDRKMTESLMELNADVSRWLLVMSDARSGEARSLMSMVDDWLLMESSRAIVR